MTIELLYLTTQMQRWINLQVARHLEAQAAKLKPAKGRVLLGADGPGGSVRLDRNGLPDGSPADETDSIDTDSIDTDHVADSMNYPAAQMAMCDYEKQKQTVHA
jgi:hypothetical protein